MTDEPVGQWPIKPLSPIKSWGGWPEDVVPVLRVWNNRRRLRFDSSGMLRVNGYPVAICAECGEPYKMHSYAGATLDGKPHCDDCVIVLARRALKAVA